MIGGFNLESFQLSGSEETQFLELLDFALIKGTLTYSFFKRYLGISRTQWDIFRLENLEKQVEWAY